jgi:hypothetical protein
MRCRRCCRRRPSASAPRLLDLTARADQGRSRRCSRAPTCSSGGLHADALAGLGYDDETLIVLNPGLSIASLDAYGWDGPWRDRRGFDSLVQMSCGIAADGAAATGRTEPTPLPVQALDHATGWLLAAAVARALTRRRTHSVAARIHASLIGTANLLYSLPPAVGRPPKGGAEGLCARRHHDRLGPSPARAVARTHRRHPGTLAAATRTARAAPRRLERAGEGMNPARCPATRTPSASFTPRQALPVGPR